MENNQPKKIAVLGGGLAAMTSVFHLLQEPDAAKKYDITVYQLGWRIGGKGASGVNPEKGYRIEEHGLHLWMGFYENAFYMMRKIYEKLGRDPNAPMSDFDKAFKGQSYMVFAENYKDQWLDWQINFPTLEGKVGDGAAGTFENLIDSIFHDILRKIEDWILHKKNLPVDPEAPSPQHHFWPHFLEEEVNKIKSGIENEFAHAAIDMFKVVCELMKKVADAEETFLGLILNAIEHFNHWIWNELGKFIENDNTARRVWISIDLFSTMFRGMIRDGMIKKYDGVVKIDFDLINRYDYSEWFTMHGANEQLTSHSVFVKAMYDGPFAFLKGEVNKPNIEAGTMLRNFLRLGFTCKENVVWRMQAGMGDTIFGPAYEVFTKQYNVKFKFFHRVVNLKPSADGHSIGSVEISRQVRLNGVEYDPFMNVKGLNCWPSRPKYDQLNPEDAALLMADSAINLESSWTSWKDTGGTLTIEAGKDYDAIILGASLASMNDLCSGLIASNSHWQDMMNKVKTVQTQAWQFWLNKSPDELKVERQKLLSTYVEPVDTFAEMNQLLDREDWPASANTQYIAYMCGAFDDAPVIPPYSDHSFPAEEYDRVKQNLANYFGFDLYHLLPNAYNNDGFNWDYLVDLSGSNGVNRLYQQYIRANIDPSDRYVLSVTDSSKHRIRTDDTGYYNLFITGDWIQNHFNAGFVECAVGAGILTARAVSGNKEIPLYLPLWDKMDL